MSGAPLPPVIPEPFANDAAVGNSPGNKTLPILDSSGDPQEATWSAGFPALTMQPIVAGGKPVKGQNVNGVLFTATAHDYFRQAGQMWPYNADVATAIGGYAVGAEVISADGSVVWINVVDANVTDPDSGSNFGWVAAYAYGNTTKNGLTGGTITLSPSEAAKKVIVLNGTLSSNLTVVLPTPGSRQWIIVNNLTGAFVTTVTGTGGTGVVIPQGGFSNPVEVYSTPANNNVYPLTPQAALIPVDQAGTPNTLAERDNLGRLRATDFVTSATPTNFGVVNCFYGDGDGTIYTITKANFQAALQLSGFAGGVVPGQVPQAAVTQYAPALLASAALTGVPTAPTAAVGTSNGQVASTQFANPFSLLNTNGAFRLPGGHLVCYGTANPNGGTVGVTLPGGLSYTNANSYSVMAISVAGSAVQTWIGNTGKTASSFNLSNSGGSAFWFTVGF